MISTASVLTLSLPPSPVLSFALLLSLPLLGPALARVCNISQKAIVQTKQQLQSGPMTLFVNLKYVNVRTQLFDVAGF